MPKRIKRFWIKERHNPQLGIYYEGCGQLSNTAAKAHERPVYGDNVMLPFDTEEAYNAKLAALREAGQSVH